jgi:hypothetical protein
MELLFNLHPPQLQIFESPARFKVCAAGRRFGKSYLSAVTLLIEGLKNKNDQGYDLGEDIVVYYVAPTFQQGKDIMWKLIKGLGEGVIKQTLENTGVIKLINGREIHIKGSDRPDTLRGVGLSYIVLDEYADMKPQVWEEILSPTLADVEGGALFIGTPKGKNHFYELLKQGERDEEWDCFEFKSMDNPFIPLKEIEKQKGRLSADVFRQEFEASFNVGGGAVFQPDMFTTIHEAPEGGNYYIAVDPAGFGDTTKKSKSKLARLDQHAIAIVKVGEYGWHVEDVQVGRWDVRETSIKIIKAYQKYRPMKLGIEGGSLKNAIMPYLTDQMRRLNIYFTPIELTHGGQRKIDRVTWALQGRLEHGRVSFTAGHYLTQLVEQALDFPNPLTHDDMLDALAYIDQIAVTSYIDNAVVDTWEAMDDFAGY